MKESTRWIKDSRPAKLVDINNEDYIKYEGEELPRIYENCSLQCLK